MRAFPLGVAQPRAHWVDAGRGVALAAMVVYHAAFDSVLFGVTDWPVASHVAWLFFAAGIASSFIFLSGISLVYAHGDGIRWKPFLRRLAVLCAAAAAVTVATEFATPAPIYFGILHAIAAFSVLALPFLFLPTAAVVGVAGVVFALPALWRSDLFSHPVFYPVGLAPTPPLTFDYEPIFPWFGVTLIGIALARSLPRPCATHAPRFLFPVLTAGRNSLLIYLIHQPILFALFILAT